MCSNTQNKHKYAQLSQGDVEMSIELLGGTGAGLVVEGSKSKNTVHHAFGSDCSAFVAVKKAWVEANVLPVTLMSRLLLNATPSWENVHFQVPASERATDFRTTSDPTCTLPSGPFHCTVDSGIRPFTWHWSSTLLPSWRSPEGLAKTDTDRDNRRGLKGWLCWFYSLIIMTAQPGKIVI